MQAQFFYVMMAVLFTGLNLTVRSQTLEDFAVCETVEAREPVNQKTTFLVNDKAYCWLKVVHATVGDSIAVEWYHEDELIHTSKLALKYANMRTYANKTLHKAGKWRVVIRTSAGVALAAEDMVVEE